MTTKVSKTQSTASLLLFTSLQNIQMEVHINMQKALSAAMKQLHTVVPNLEKRNQLIFHIAAFQILCGA
jgi:hypothetical protein